jgi:hypothetical protein
MRTGMRNGFLAAAATAMSLLAATPALSLERGHVEGDLYIAPGALFTARSPLGSGAHLIDSFDRSAGAVTFLNDAGELYGVVCTPNMDVLAGADNDYETDVAILRNWLHGATFPLFFERQLPGSKILEEQPGHLEGRPAWFAIIHLPEGSSQVRNDPETGYPRRLDSWRALVVFSRGDHTYLIMKEVEPEVALPSVLRGLSGFYQGMTFADDHPFFALNR